MDFDADRDSPDAVVERAVTTIVMILVTVAVPAVLFFDAVELLRGRGGPTLTLHAAVQGTTILGVVATRRGSYRVRAAILAAYGLLTVLATALHFGFHVGLGVSMMGAAIWGGLTLGRRGALVVAVALGATLSVVAVGTARGWIPRPSVLLSDATSFANWLRWAVSLSIGAAAISWLVDRFLRDLERSLERAGEALRESRAARAARERAEEELEQALRMEALARVAKGAGRDLASAFAVVLRNARALADDGDAEQIELAREIEAAASRVSQTVAQLSALHGEPGEPRGEADVGDVLAQMARTLSRALPRSVTLVQDVRVDRRVALSATALERVILNLCLNARDAMSSGGVITLRARPLDEGSAAGGARVEVVDEGAGIPEEIRGRVFEPFFTTKEHGRGTGLGLTQVHALVTAVGGSVRLEPGREGGTSVLVDLPPPRDELGAATGAILVVDEETSIQRIMRRVLVQAGFEVVAAGDVPGAEAKLDDGVEIAALVLDAELTGAERVIEAYRARWPDRPVILSSTRGRGAVERLRVGGERVDFLPKPFTTSALVAAVRTALGVTPGRDRRRS